MCSSDTLPWDGLQISFQRYSRSVWSANKIIRSWACAPWKLIGEDRVAVACFPNEAIWFGMTVTGAAVRIRLESRSGRWVRDMRVPPEWQLSWIQQGDRKRPIALRPDCQSAFFTMSVRGSKQTKTRNLEITLLVPDAWRRKLGELEIVLAEEPEAVALYSRIMPVPDLG